MSEEILVNVTPQETRVAVLGSGQVQELVVERAASRGLVGNIYMGKVARVLPGMQSAFVEIGLERAAFLQAMATQSMTRAVLSGRVRIAGDRRALEGLGDVFDNPQPDFPIVTP